MGDKKRVKIEGNLDFFIQTEIDIEAEDLSDAKNKVFEAFDRFSDLIVQHEVLGPLVLEFNNAEVETYEPEVKAE